MGLQEVGRGRGSCLPRVLLGRGWCPSHGTPGLNPVLGGTSAVGRNSQRQLDGSEKENSAACKIRRVDISRTGRKTLRNTPAHGVGAVSLFPARFPRHSCSGGAIPPGCPEPVAMPGSSSQRPQSSTEDCTFSKDTRTNAQTCLTSDRNPFSNTWNLMSPNNSGCQQLD